MFELYCIVWTLVLKRNDVSWALRAGRAFTAAQDVTSDVLLLPGGRIDKG